MKSPLTGREMKLMSEPSTLDYKGKTYNVIHHYYLCELTNEQFTTTELDEQNLQELNKQVKLDFLNEFGLGEENEEEVDAMGIEAHPDEPSDEQEEEEPSEFDDVQDEDFNQEED